MPRKPDRYKLIDERLDRMSAVLNGLIAESAEWKREAEARKRDLDRSLQQLSREVGKVTNGLGMFAEGLVGPSLYRLLPRLGIRVSGVSQRSKRALNGETMEIDLLAVGRRTRSRAPVVAVIEVTVQLSPLEVGWCLGKLPRLFDFFPEYRGSELVAGVAGMTVDETVAKHAERQGLMVFGPGDEVARMLNRPDFRPKVWSSSETGRQER